jgi:hypothetical protein
LRTYKNSLPFGNDVTYFVPPEPPKQRQWLAGGKVIKAGDPVRVLRDGWRDKIGMYIGKEKGRLRIRYNEHGGALLLCQPSEVRAAD